jgi:uncharacterized protein YjiS (DUF1127 family)
MNTHSYTLYTHDGPWARAMRTLVARLRAAPGAVLARLAAASRRAAHRREMQSLSDADLRDLGLHRSEIDSCWAESEGIAPATRRRLLYFDRR